MLESKFQANLIKELKKRFEGCVVLKNDAGYLIGIPDLLVLYEDKWAALECKRDIRQMSRQVSRGSTGDYQADEQAGVTRFRWRVSGR